jgi:hypothetical protein
MYIDLLQQALLVVSQKYPVLGMKLAWNLFANSTDYNDKKVSQVQQVSGPLGDVNNVLDSMSARDMIMHYISRSSMSF